MTDEAPAFPFFIEAENVNCWVVEMVPEQIEDPLDEAWVNWTPLVSPFNGPSEPVITMRVYDERVLLHEVMHVAFKRETEVLNQWVMTRRDEDFAEQARGAEEGIVRMLTATLFSMGWRWKVRDRDELAVERDQRRAFDGRQRVLESVERDARAEHAKYHGATTFETCERDVCAVYQRAVKAARV